MTKNQLVLFFLGSLFSFAFFSCNNVKDDILSLTQSIEKLEGKEIGAISKEEWTELDKNCNELESRILEDGSSESDRNEFEKLKGRVAALKLKLQMNEWQNQLKDMTNQVEGFVDGLGN